MKTLQTQTHTAGPWRVLSDTKPAIVDSKGCHVALAWKQPTIGAEEAQANAALIASAPDLLAALKASHAKLCSIIPYGANKKDTALLEQSDKAIAKAERGTP
jgi:hypothetical protein